MRTSPRTKLVYKCSASLSDFGIPQRNDNGVQLHKLKKWRAVHQVVQPAPTPAQTASAAGPTETPGTGGTGNLGLNDGSVLAALLFDVFLDF